MEKFHFSILLDKKTYKELKQKVKKPHAFIEHAVDEALNIKQCPTCGHKLKSRSRKKHAPDTKVKAPMLARDMFPYKDGLKNKRHSEAS